MCSIPYSYDEILSHSIKYDCKVLDNEEFIKNNYHAKIKIISKCGHNSMETICNFIKKKKGIYCKDCMELINESRYLTICFKCKKAFIPNKNSYLFCSDYCKHSREQKEKTKEAISIKIKEKENLTTFNKEIYLEGNLYIRNILSEHFNIDLTNRCCPYNYIIKPKNPENLENKTNHELLTYDKIWLPVEIKYSKTSNKHFCFSIRKKSCSMITICINLENKLVWIFPPDIYNYTTKLKINKNMPSKFDIYKVDINNIIDKINELYNNHSNIFVCMNDNLEQELGELNHHMKVEYDYKFKRLKSIQFLNFQNPISNFETHNFLINDFKIQECVSFIDAKTRYQIVSIHKKVNKISVPFSYTDNDFYWIHERMYNNFYLIPSNILHEKEYLSSEFVKGRNTLNIDKNQDWLIDYKFSYDTINEFEWKNKLLKMLNLLN